MNAFTPPRDFSGQPHRAHDVITIIGRANHALGRALVPPNRRPSRGVNERMLGVVKAIQVLAMYLNGATVVDLESVLTEASSAIAALEMAIERDRRTIAGRLARWLHFRRHPEEYSIVAVAPSRFGKGTGSVIPNLLGWDGPARIHDPKADPNTLH